MNYSWSEQAGQEKDALRKIMLTVQECADYSGMSPGAIRRLINEGRLPAVRIGVKMLVNKAVLDNLLQGEAQGPVAETVQYGTVRRVV